MVEEDLDAPPLAEFCIPLISGILGQLMPKQDHKLIPLSSLKDLIIELELNPYAFFSSGYQNTRYTDPLVLPQFSRNAWYSSKVELVGEVIELDEQTDKAIQKSLS